MFGEMKIYIISPFHIYFTASSIAPAKMRNTVRLKEQKNTLWQVEYYVCPVSTCYAAVRLFLRNPNPNPNPDLCLTLTPISVFLRLFVVETEARTGQTDRRTYRQTDEQAL